MVVGVITNNSVEATVRMAGNLDLQSTLLLRAASPLVAPIGMALHGMQKM